MKRFLATLLVSILLSGSLLAAPPKKPTAPQPRSVEEIETLHEEALELFDQGQYPQAKAKVKQALSRDKRAFFKFTEYAVTFLNERQYFDYARIRRLTVVSIDLRELPELIDQYDAQTASVS